MTSKMWSPLLFGRSDILVEFLSKGSVRSGKIYIRVAKSTFLTKTHLLNFKEKA